MKLHLPESGIVIGVGIDLVDVARIQRAYERQTERFLARIFTVEEQEYCLRMRNPYPHLAARFAAKEAISKAFSTGIGEHFGWKSASVYKGAREQPLVRLDPLGEKLLAAVGATDIHLSLTHTATAAAAVAILVRHSDATEPGSNP